MRFGSTFGCPSACLSQLLGGCTNLDPDECYAGMRQCSDSWHYLAERETVRDKIANFLDQIEVRRDPVF